MLISMILPTYKVRKYIGACISSCCNQVGVLPDDYEIIIVNDETPDDSIEVAQEEMKKYPNHHFKIINRKNGGLSAARNSGIEVAEGEYLWFIDSDDYIESDSLFTLMPIAKEGIYDIINFTHNTIYKNGKKIEGNNGGETDACTGIVYLSKRSFLSVCTGIYRRVWIEEHNLRFKEGVIWEDSEFNLRAYSLTEDCLYIGKSLYNYIRREDSISDSKATPESTYSRISNAFGLDEYFSVRGVTLTTRTIIDRHIMGMLIAAMAGLPELEPDIRRSFRSQLSHCKRKLLKMAKSTKQIIPMGISIMYCAFPRVTEVILNNRIHAAIRRSTTSPISN